jgi:nucleoside-diphosphate-sugar epimerase
VPRFVNISSETVPGFFFPERPFLPDYVPVDEEHPIRPQDPYATAKYFGELLMDGAIRRSDIRCISIRPSWVQHEGNYERNLGPMVRDRSELSAGIWSYIDVYDLADAMVLAAESGLATRSSTSPLRITWAAGRWRLPCASTTGTRSR